MPAITPITPITPTYHVSPQLEPREIAAIAAAGYTTLVCMRPDGETFGQPAWAQIEAEARRHGLQVHYIPAQSGAVTPAQAAQLKQVLAQAPGKVLAYCASGNRCAIAYQMARQLPG
ncbi:MAG: TIGR01244 family sulfur transferase [Thermomonas haemolytica]